MEREVGRMQAEIEALTVAVDKLTGKVESIEKTLSEAKGGWRVLMIFGGAGSIIGAGLTKFVEFLSAAPPH
jgi:hypothetical protein